MKKEIVLLKRIHFIFKKSAGEDAFDEGKNMYNLKNRETIEWTNTWVENAQDSECKRILLIGDSVTREFRGPISTLIPAYAIDFIGMSFSIEDDMLYHYLNAFFAANEYKYDLCILNIAGKHGYYLDTKYSREDQIRFENAYDTLLAFVKKNCPNIVVLTVTPSVSADKLKCWDDKVNEEIHHRNLLMIKSAQKFMCPCIDIFPYCKEKRFKYRDSMHFADRKTQYEIVRFILNKLISIKKIPQEKVLPPLEKKFWGLYKRKNNLKQIKTKILFGLFTKLQENEKDSYYLLGVCVKKIYHPLFETV